jgi:predicted amidophosphoribosyltransferase
VATVFELTEPYRNHLVPILPRGPGVCATCWTAVNPGFQRCYLCQVARSAHGPQLADIVIPMALAVKGQQLAHELWHYKYDADPAVRRRLDIRLAAVLWRFLAQHEACIAQALSVPSFSIVTTVPGTRKRDDEHPLARITRTLVHQTRNRYQELLTLGADASAPERIVLADRYRPTRSLAGEQAILLIDDTWTTGARAQSAAIALRRAGAAKVAIVVLGRHFDRSYGSGETYYREATVLSVAMRTTWPLTRSAGSAGTNAASMQVSLFAHRPVYLLIMAAPKVHNSTRPLACSRGSVGVSDRFPTV